MPSLSSAPKSRERGPTDELLPTYKSTHFQVSNELLTRAVERDLSWDRGREVDHWAFLRSHVYSYVCKSGGLDTEGFRWDYKDAVCIDLRLIELSEVSYWHVPLPARQPIERKTQTQVDSVQERFRKLAKQWKAETGLLSNIWTKSMHPAYQQIIGLGKAAIPLMLEDFQAGKYYDWFWALSAVSGGENPVHSDMRGDVQAMAEAWVEWGKTKHYLSA